MSLARLPLRCIAALLLPATLGGCLEPELPDDAEAGAPLDAARPDDAMAPGEAQPADASPQEAGSGDAAPAADAGLPDAHGLMDGAADAEDAGSSSEQVCLTRTPTPGHPNLPCPAELCLPARSLFRVTSGELLCSENPGCKLPPDPNLIGMQGVGTYLQVFRHADDDLSVSLDFNNELLYGYSLNAFRRYAMGGGGSVHMVVAGQRTLFHVFDGHSEILGYEQGKLHFRLTGRVHHHEMLVQVPPFICQVGEVLPSICTQTKCFYGVANEAGAADAPRVTIEGNLPIEQIAP